MQVTVWFIKVNLFKSVYLTWWAVTEVVHKLVKHYGLLYLQSQRTCRWGVNWRSGLTSTSVTII